MLLVFTLQLALLSSPHNEQPVRGTNSSAFIDPTEQQSQPGRIQVDRMGGGYKPLVQNGGRRKAAPVVGADSGPLRAASRDPRPPPAAAAVSTDHPSSKHPRPPSRSMQDFPPSHRTIPRRCMPSTGPPPVLEAYQPAPQYVPVTVNTNNTPRPLVQKAPPPPTPHVHVEQLASTVDLEQAAPFSKPKNYRAYSVLNMIFCCFVCGFIASICGCQVDKHYRAGRLDKARSASRTARHLLVSSTVLGLAVVAVAVVAVAAWKLHILFII